MKNTLIPEVRADKTGKLVTRHVRADNGPVSDGKRLPAPALASASGGRRKRFFKPNEEQLASGRYGIAVNQPDPTNWGPHVIGEPHPDLAAVPFTARQAENYTGNYYRFDANALEYYSVMSAVRPFDAINLLHRGIKSADEARAFLEDNGIGHLIGDYSDYTDELLRHRITPNLAMVYMNDVIDAAPDPVLAGEWVKMCSQKSILDEARFIKDEMLSGQVTAEDLKAVGVKNLAADIEAVAKYIIHSKNDNNPDFTLTDIRMVMEDVTDSIQYEKSKWKSSRRWSTDVFVSENDTAPARLAIVRAMGKEGVLAYYVNVGMHDWELKRMEASGNVDPERLGKITYFSSRLGTHLRTEKDFIAMSELFDSGADLDKTREFLRSVTGRRMTAAEQLNAAKEGVHTAVVGGWL